jgi:hypothetical protein
MPLQLVYECKGRVIFGCFQIIQSFLRRLVATELGICDKLRTSTHLRVAKEEIAIGVSDVSVSLS